MLRASHTLGASPRLTFELPRLPFRGVRARIRRLRAIEDEGERGAAALLVLARVLLTLVPIVTLETTVAFAFYFGWL